MSRGRRVARAALASVALVCAVACSSDESQDRTGAPDPIVIPTGTLLDTTLGPVRGHVDGGVREFLGIPYADPPVGEFRFRAPQPAESWTAPFEAAAFGATCPQRLPVGDGVVANTSEDCLTLNVWTPEPAPTEVRPVMFWIHGGGFAYGASSEATYHGKLLVERAGVVLVTVSYRVGPLGFLASPALASEDPRGATGNQGLLDQRLALEWVKANAVAFGGDPERVTAFGESAGGMSTCSHLVMPESVGLFDRAIIESGPCPRFFPTLADASLQTADLADALGCGEGDLACLRDQAPDAIVLALQPDPRFFFGGGVAWSPVIDGVDLTDQPALLLEQGPASVVPTLIGSNADDSNPFLLIGGLDASTPALFEMHVRDLFGTDADAILAEYPPTPTPAAALSAIFSQWIFNCPSREAARATARAGAPTFLYHFGYENESAFFTDQGAFHGSEVPFVFGTSFLGSQIGAEDEPLVEAIMGYWSRFAAEGDPNGDGAVLWPEYDAESDEHLALDLPIEKGSALLGARCDFWRDLDARGP